MKLKTADLAAGDHRESGLSTDYCKPLTSVKSSGGELGYVLNMQSQYACRQITRPSTSVTIARFTNRRLAREWKTVTAMVHIYCREQHGNSLCAECQDLMRYISLRLDRCRFGEEKPTCAKCPVHCYQRDRREQIKTVMRFAGPRMLWEHPWLSMSHLLDGWFRRSAPALLQSGRPPTF